MNNSSKNFSDDFLDIFLEYESFLKNNINLNVDDLFHKIKKLSDNDEKKLLLEYVIFKLIEKDNMVLVKEINTKLFKNKNVEISSNFKNNYTVLFENNNHFTNSSTTASTKPSTKPSTNSSTNSSTTASTIASTKNNFRLTSSQIPIMISSVTNSKVPVLQNTVLTNQTKEHFLNPDLKPNPINLHNNNISKKSNTQKSSNPSPKPKKKIIFDNNKIRLFSNNNYYNIPSNILKNNNKKNIVNIAFYKAIEYKKTSSNKTNFVKDYMSNIITILKYIKDEDINNLKKCLNNDSLKSIESLKGFAIRHRKNNKKIIISDKTSFI